jgi:hypothetical protein
MSKELTEISPDLAIPGFDVKVKNKHSCQVKSQDGRYEFSVEMDESYAYPLRFSGNMLHWPFADGSLAIGKVGAWESRGIKFTTDADDAITHVANCLKLMDQLSSEGFSAKIERGLLIFSHPSKPGYHLSMRLADSRKIVPLKNTSLYTFVEYHGPAYAPEANTKWQLNGINNSRLIVTNKGLEELAQEIKARILSLGEEKDPSITQWVSEEIEKELVSQEFTFIPKPEEGIVEFSHPSSFSGSLAFAPFTAGKDYIPSPKYSNPQFPTDIETGKVVLFTLDRPNSRKPYTKAFLAKEPQDVIDEFRQFLALPLLHREVCHTWKSDILVPKLNGNSLQLVNTKIEGNGSIILELTAEKGKLRLKNKGKPYEISDDPGKIAQTIADLAEKHVQEFIQENGIKLTNTRVVEIDF